jgi:AbrB family looped-hinge helix DNA binding protein
MTQRVGAKGQVVIPKDLRDELGLQPGAEVDFERDGGTVRITPAGAPATDGLRGPLPCGRTRRGPARRSCAIKAAHPIAFADCIADCIAAATAAREATLLTGDPELIDRPVGCRVRHLRSDSRD